MTIVNKKLAIIFLGVLLIISLVSASTLYDDFSGSSLDSSKWIVKDTFEHWPFLQYSYLDTTNQVYHQEQTNIDGSRETMLEMNHLFFVGDSVEYDVNYVSGNGNCHFVARVSFLD